MSVLIKGINIPKGCWGCRFRRWENGYGDQCIITDTFIKDIFIKEKDCPLVEIPPHGDLVDKDYLLFEYDRQHEGPAGGARKIIEDAPAIIDAEGRKI